MLDGAGAALTKVVWAKDLICKVHMVPSWDGSTQQVSQQELYDQHGEFFLNDSVSNDCSILFMDTERLLQIPLMYFDSL